MRIHTSKVAGMDDKWDLGTSTGSHSHQTHFNDAFLGKKDIGDKKIEGNFILYEFFYFFYNRMILLLMYTCSQKCNSRNK